MCVYALFYCSQQNVSYLSTQKNPTTCLMRSLNRLVQHKGKKTPKHWHKGNYAHRKISSLVQALDSLVSAEKRRALKGCANCHCRGSTDSSGSIRPGQERVKVVERCTESEQPLNAPIHTWEERGEGESDTIFIPSEH